MTNVPKRSRAFSLAGSGVLIASILAGDCSDVNEATDPVDTCEDDNAPPAEVRVHVGNPGNVEGISVTVEIDISTLREVCTIEELPLNGELAQVVMEGDVGTPITITAQFEGAASRVCTVSSQAFENLDDINAENGQVFADVTTEPLAVTCAAGFEVGGLAAVVRPGGSPGR